MQQSLDVISVNFWQILSSLLNLVILFLLIRHFLYKPVRKMISERKQAVDEQYASAQKAQSEAEESKALWTERLENAKGQADDIIKTATLNAERRSEEITLEAKNKADIILQRAKTDAEAEKRKAAEEIKGEIVDVSSLIAEKILSREINPDEHRDIIASFLDEIGDENG